MLIVILLLIAMLFIIVNDCYACWLFPAKFGFVCLSGGKMIWSRLFVHDWLSMRILLVVESRVPYKLILNAFNSMVLIISKGEKVDRN